MKPIKVLFDKVGNTLNVWFDDPQKEHISEETGAGRGSGRGSRQTGIGAQR